LCDDAVAIRGEGGRDIRTLRLLFFADVGSKERGGEADSDALEEMKSKEKGAELPISLEVNREKKGGGGR